MKMKFSTKLISVLLVVIMLVSIPLGTMQAAAADKGKYVKDVFIAYGETVQEAKNWLTANGWEPVGDDLNAGNTSHNVGFKNAVAFMGIKRTDNPNEAITDMATMNMKGGYDFDDYDALVEEKKTDINQFIKTFQPVLEEYRANYNGEGGEGGKKRAQFAHDLLNKFYDGKDDQYAKNDTGLPLGDLFLNKTADFTQIILESTGPAVMFIEQALALATDTREGSWLDLVKTLTGDGLRKNTYRYVSGAPKNPSPSQAINLLNNKFQDTAKRLAGEWSTMNADLIWYEEYCDTNDLWQKEEETNDDYAKRAEAYFATLKEENETKHDDEYTRFYNVGAYYPVLNEVKYPGTWGSTLYDFFRDTKGLKPGKDIKNFLPFAAVLSPGQRAGVKYLSLSTLIKLGSTGEEVMQAQFPKINDLFKGENKDSISVYTGVNRAIFRKGVALTSTARMRKDMGDDPYDVWLADGGYGYIITYTVMGAGLVTMVTGVVMTVRAYKAYDVALAAQHAAEAAVAARSAKIATICKNTEHFSDIMWKAQERVNNINWMIENNYATPSTFDNLGPAQEALAKATKDFNKAEVVEKELINSLGDKPEVQIAKMSTTGRWLMGIGGALMLIAAAVKIIEITQFYDREFTVIPSMIVDEANIVSYDTDENGKQTKNINFNQFLYYEVVKCNRQQIGLHKNAQDGVDEYDDWGCGDFADLNADVGKQWLALYVNRSREKGDPMLADGIKVQYGSDGIPDGYNGILHMFTFKNPVDVGDAAYCFRNDKKGTYVFWKSDANAYTATSINYGYLAIAGIGGIALGILGTTLVILPKRKKEQENTAPATV